MFIREGEKVEWIPQARWSLRWPLCLYAYLTDRLQNDKLIEILAQKQSLEGTFSHSQNIFHLQITRSALGEGNKIMKGLFIPSAVMYWTLF